MTTRRGVSLVAVVAAFVLIIPPIPSVAAFKYLEKGMKAPAVSGVDLTSGKQVSSAPDGEGRSAVCVVFWASWSPRSLELLGDLKNLCNRLEGEPFQVVAVNVDSQVTTSLVEQRVRKIVFELDPPFPVIVDDGLEIFYEFGVIAVPSYVILDAEGVARFTPSGYSYSTRDHLTEQVETVLGLRESGIADTGAVAYRPSSEAARYHNLAVQLANKRLYEAALRKVDMAMAADTLFAAPHALRGQIRLELGEPDQAVEDFRKAVELDSASVSARAGLGRALLEGGDPESARDMLEVAVESDSSYTEALQDLARCLAAMGEADRAVDILDDAIELYPHDPRMYYYLGRIHRDAGRQSMAVEAYRKSLAMVFPRP